jgi:hypothetical protein
MDHTEAFRSSADVADDAFQDSLARLTQQIAARRSTMLLLPAPLPAPRRQWRGWPFLLLIAVAGAATAGYHSAAFVDGDLSGIVKPPVAEAAVASPTRGPVLAAIAVAPEPVAPPTAEAPAAREEPAPAVEEAAAAPPPPPSVEAAPGAPAADAPAEIALAWAEVLEVQKRLVSVGINPGPLDGIVGPRTMGGVERYEELHGRPVTGRVDRRLLKLLQQDPDSSATLEARAR